VTIAAGEVISYHTMCGEEGVQLQRGMNFKLRSGRTVILMSRRANAPYRDEIVDEGTTIIYEGHDAPKTAALPFPKQVDQPDRTPSGSITQNGRFAGAAESFKQGFADAELVSVYEKIQTGIWVFNGIFRLVDAWRERDDIRQVFRFRLEMAPERQDPSPGDRTELSSPDLPHTRVIPSEVKLEVWRRDGGCCVKCGATDNLHFDHILPFSRGGTSLRAENIQILCARHNLEKRDRIE
jgi:hypothetical protein